MSRFARVVHRQGWDVEIVWESRTLNFPDAAAALAAAEELKPEWIEVGEIVPATPTAPQHHRWRTLRRTAAGAYEESTLRWAGRQD